MSQLFDCIMLCQIRVNDLQYCAKDMRANFEEFRGFSSLFDEKQRIIKKNDISTNF